MNFTGFLAGEMLELDGFQFSTNDQLLYMKSKTKQSFLILAIHYIYTDLSTPCPKHVCTGTHTHTHTVESMHSHTKNSKPFCKKLIYTNPVVKQEHTQTEYDRTQDCRRTGTLLYIWSPSSLVWQIPWGHPFPRTPDFPPKQWRLQGLGPKL